MKGSAAWKKIEAEPISDAERELLDKISAAGSPPTRAFRNRSSLLVNQGKTIEANKMMVNETLPLLNKYRDAWAAFSEYRRRSDESGEDVQSRGRVTRSSGGFRRR